MGHPPFVDVKFYPGHSYPTGNGVTSYSHPRYVGLTRDGEVYVKTTCPNDVWEKI